MLKVIIAIFLLAIVAISIANLKKRGGLGDGGAWPFYAKKPLTQNKWGRQDGFTTSESEAGPTNNSWCAPLRQIVAFPLIILFN